MKGGTLPGLAGGVDITLMILGYFPAHGQTNAGTAVFCFAMEALEDAEDLICILLFETDAIVLDPDVDLLAADTGGDGDQRNSVGTGIFERIGDKVAEKLCHLQRECIDGGQVMVLEPGGFLLDKQLEFGFDLFHNSLKADRLESGKLPRQF